MARNLPRTYSTPQRPSRTNGKKNGREKDGRVEGRGEEARKGKGWRRSKKDGEGDGGPQLQFVDPLVCSSITRVPADMKYYAFC